MNKKIIIIVCFLLIVAMCFSIRENYFGNTKNDIDKNVYADKNYENMLSMMLERSAGSGDYQETTASAWPTDGYVFNETLSKCEQGSSLRWDSTKNTVVMNGNVSDKCYVYFDVKPPEYLVDHIKSLYTTQGANNLYLHDSTLTNGAGDNSYRYAGSSDTTNNFVCFGYDSTDETCPTDYLYRIIGVFDNQVKLIKYDYANSNLLGTDGDYSTTGISEGGFGSSKYKGELTTINLYYWNNNSGTVNNTWSNSLLNKTNLNTNYLNNIGSNWSNKIAIHTWKVGGNTLTNIRSAVVTSAYQNEITNPAANTTYDAKVGLMHVSDYGYAAAPSAWSTTLYKYNSSSITDVNWMYMGIDEWTILPRTDDSSDSTITFFVYNTGRLDTFRVSLNYGIRPVFYLNSNITYVSGSGTASSPILIK